MGIGISCSPIDGSCTRCIPHWCVLAVFFINPLVNLALIGCLLFLFLVGLGLIEQVLDIELILFGKLIWFWHRAAEVLIKEEIDILFTVLWQYINVLLGVIGNCCAQVWIAAHISFWKSVLIECLWVEGIELILGKLEFFKLDICLMVWLSFLGLYLFSLIRLFYHLMLFRFTDNMNYFSLNTRLWLFLFHLGFL